MKLNKTQAAIILGGVYIFMSLAANIASTKLFYLGKFVTDAGFIYYFIFTWRDLIHKQLGKKAAITTIYVAGAVNILATLYFQLVVYLPAESEWALAGGQAAWHFLFGIQMRIVIASVLAFVISELVDTKIYELWVKGIGKNKPQWLRVVISNMFSIPVDTLLFVVIAFTGVVSSTVMWHIIITNVLLKVLVTFGSFWMIYLVPEKKIYS